jgi:hypothetical protein
MPVSAPMGAAQATLLPAGALETGKRCSTLQGDTDISYLVSPFPAARTENRCKGRLLLAPRPPTVANRVSSSSLVADPGNAASTAGTRHAK